MRIVPGTPRWAVVAAAAVPVCVLPSVVYRIMLIPSGFPSVDLYLGALSAGSMVLALLTLGLVQPWGERLGRRAIPRAPVVAAATTGAVLIALLGLYAIVNSVFGFVDHGPVLVGADEPAHPPPAAWVVWCYVPLLAWPPLLLAVTAAYHRRRSPRPAVRTR